MKIDSAIFKTRDGIRLATNTWLPAEPKSAPAVIVLVHGMCEHSLRYDRTASTFAEEGFIVVSYDQRGHGKTAVYATEDKTGEMGLLAKKGGFDKVVGDLGEVINKAKKDYSGKKIVLFGHSFGSFVSIGFIENMPLVDECILCGTSGKMEGLAKEGLALIGFTRLFHKRTYKSKAVRDIMFGRYLKRIKDAKTGLEWLSKNTFNQELYQADEWCGGVATLQFYQDLLKAIIAVNKKRAISKISKELPIFLIAGSDDPVGRYGKGVKKLAETYKSCGIKSVECKLYEGDRHEILNELDADNVIADCVAWIKAHL